MAATSVRTLGPHGNNPTVLKIGILCEACQSAKREITRLHTAKKKRLQERRNNHPTPRMTFLAPRRTPSGQWLPRQRTQKHSLLFGLFPRHLTLSDGSALSLQVLFFVHSTGASGVSCSSSMLLFCACATTYCRVMDSGGHGGRTNGTCA
jgi:hypothetical protein